MSRQLHELFLASCGVYGQWGVRIARTAPVVEERAFSAPYAFVGNQQGTSLCLTDPDVSRRHAYLQVIPGGLFCIDLGSRRGLRWGDEDREAGWLRPGHPMRVGSYSLDLVSENQDGWFAPLNWPPGDPLADRVSETAPLPPFIVEIADGATFLAHGKLNRVIALVGRSSRCLFHIRHPGLSKFHCSLVRTPTGLWVVDLLSRRGTFLNGRRVRCARVHEGDAVQVGKYSLHFRLPRLQSRSTAATVVESVGVRNGGNGRSTLLVRPTSNGQNPEPLHALEATSSALKPQPAPMMMTGPVENGGGADWSLIVALVNQFNVMQQNMFDQFQESILTTSRMFASLQQDQMKLVREELKHLRALTGELRTLQGEQHAKPPKAMAASAPAPTPAPPRPQVSPPAAAAAANGKPSSPPSPVAGQRSAESATEVHDWLNQRIAAIEEERRGRWQKLLGMILGN